MADTASENDMSGVPAPAEPKATGYSWYVLSVLVVVHVRTRAKRIGAINDVKLILVGVILVGNKKRRAAWYGDASR